MHAFKHHAATTPELIARIEAAQTELSIRHKASQDLAATFPFETTARYYRDPWNGRHSEIFIRPNAAPAKEAITAGWRYLKTRNTLEPLAGAKGQDAKEALAAVQPPKVQPRDILHESGMPEYFTKPGANFNTYMVVPTYACHDGAIYSLVDVEDLTGDFGIGKPQTFGGDWETCPVSEYYAAIEAMEATKRSPRSPFARPSPCRPSVSALLSRTSAPAATTRSPRPGSAGGAPSDLRVRRHPARAGRPGGWAYASA